MPTLEPVCMADGIWWVLPSRMRLRTAGVGTSTSQATTRPEPSAVGSSCWVMTPMRATESCTRTWSCWWAGKTSMMRSIVCGALCVCSVAKTRWPVSAAVSAVEIVSRSRISPTRITSGSWRSAAFRASAEGLRVGADLALVDDALLVAVEELDRVLDGHDVLLARLVDRVDHGRQRGGLARAGRAGDEHDAARLLGEVVDRRSAGRGRRWRRCRPGSGGRRRRWPSAGSRR